MLTRLRFKNFKAWEDTGEIRLAPLTVLFGNNSAGKTSIPQLLLLLKQTAESSDRQRALQLGDGRTPVDLGTYDDAVHGHDTSRPIEIELEWTLGQTLRIADPLAQREYDGDKLTFRVVVGADKRRRSIFYVGPLREYPKRLYLWSGETPDHVGVKGDRAVEAILAAGGRSFNWRAKQKTKPLAELVAERLKSMGLISEFQVKALGQHRKEYEVLVRTSPNLPEVKLTDVGFGVSQVLPVIVESLYVPRRSIVLFEQPEIHLHPRVQAELADLFVDAIRAREGGTARDCQFIIESHSEHFLRRLQRRIAEEELSADDAALYFVHTDGASAHIEALKVDLFGNISNWPDGFFGDEMGDLVARSEAQARRMGLPVDK